MSLLRKGVPARPTGGKTPEFSFLNLIPTLILRLPASHGVGQAGEQASRNCHFICSQVPRTLQVRGTFRFNCLLSFRKKSFLPLRFKSKKPPVACKQQEVFRKCA